MHVISLNGENFVPEMERTIGTNIIVKWNTVKFLYNRFVEVQDAIFGIRDNLGYIQRRYELNIGFDGNKVKQI